MRLFLTLAILAVAAGRGALTCDLERIFQCANGVQHLDYSSADFIYSFCNISISASLCFTLESASCNEEQLLMVNRRFNLQKTASKIQEICSQQNIIAFSDVAPCLSNDRVSTRIDACVRPVIDATSGTDNNDCILRASLVDCTKNAASECGRENLVRDFSAMLDIFVRLRQPPGVDCNDEELLNECVMREGQCFSVISQMFTTTFSPFIFTPERLDQFCSAVQSVFSCDESLPEVCQNKTTLIDRVKDYHDFICSAENRNSVISAGKCINDSNVLNGIKKCQAGIAFSNPSRQCSSIKEFLKCSTESVHGACGQEVTGVFANILQGYASYGMSHFLTDCDALDVLNAY